MALGPHGTGLRPKHSFTSKPQNNTMISWNKIQRRNPISHTLAWYPQISLNGITGVEDVVAGIVGKCTLTAPDVKAVLIALEEVIIEQIKAGNTVRFGDLGSFRPTITCRAWDEEKGKWGTGGSPVATDVIDPETGEIAARGVTSDNIKGINVVFTKSGVMDRSLARQNLKFRQVSGEIEYKPKKNA